jgi:hypothetical protein
VGFEVVGGEVGRVRELSMKIIVTPRFPNIKISFKIRVF